MLLIYINNQMIFGYHDNRLCVGGKKQNFYNEFLILEGGDYLFQAYLSTLMMSIFNIY